MFRREMVRIRTVRLTMNKFSNKMGEFASKSLLNALYFLTDLLEARRKKQGQHFVRLNEKIWDNNEGNYSWQER